MSRLVDVSEQVYLDFAHANLCFSHDTFLMDR
jgi:hypothetical protein